MSKKNFVEKGKKKSLMLPQVEAGQCLRQEMKCGSCSVPSIMERSSCQRLTDIGACSDSGNN
jgi:hypothetical protein